MNYKGTAREVAEGSGRLWRFADYEFDESARLTFKQRLGFSYIRLGEGAKAEAGYRRAAPVIAALERYQRERGAYPDTLAILPTEWMPAQDKDSPAGPPLRYVRSGERYELSFSYTGPGINRCTYAPSSDAPARWHCGGYY